MHGRSAPSSRPLCRVLAPALPVLVGGLLLSGVALPAVAADGSAPTPVPTTATSPATAAPSAATAAPTTAPSAPGAAPADAGSEPAPAPAPGPGASADADGEEPAGAGSAAAPDPAVVAAYQQALAASAAASAQLSDLSARAGASLEQKDAAQERRTGALAEQARQEQLAEQARGALAKERGAVGRWASSAYRRGDVPANPLASLLLGDATTDEVGAQLVLLDHVGDRRSALLDRAVDAEKTATDAQRAADRAAAQAQDAATTADAQARLAQQLLAQQRGLVTALDTQLRTAREALAAAQARAQAQAQAQAAAAAAAAGAPAPAAPDAAPTDGAVLAALPAPVPTSYPLPADAATPLAGTCTGQDVSSYANGQIPESALCPLADAPGQRLRADAAAAFDAISSAYEQVFGVPLCVTDSYRSLEEQYSVRARKPTLAAVPGTSRHGLGIAVDLCGGIEDFGSAQHAWLMQRAPLFGWFHPSWAEPQGAKPEPWHWEFAGVPAAG